jgi:low temperature requirement protein LtrA
VVEIRCKRSGSRVEAAGSVGSLTAPHAEHEQRVTPLELFFDLVFVFAITQVTALMSEHPTWTGLAEGVLMLAALWWAWVAYAWLTNTIDPDEGAVRIAMFAAMAAMLVVSLAVPGAFGASAVAFGVAYVAVRGLHIVLYAVATDADVHGAIRRLARTTFVGSGLILLASAFDGWAQLGLWTVALAIDFGGAALSGTGGWTVSPGHFAERHGLIVLIALGESIVAVGVGAAGLPVGLALVAVALVGLTLAACMWWAYFDIDAVVAERKLREAVGRAQVAMARDSYSYLHFPIVAGIVLVALGIKKTIGHVGDPLDAMPAVALCAGLALFLLGHVAFRYRNTHTVHRLRAVVAVVALALIPVATRVPAIGALSTLAGLMTAVIAFERIRLRAFRARVRAA